MTRQQSHTASGGSSTTSGDKWWKIHLFQGMVKDIRRRAPYYWSDWADAWDYRVVPATIYMYFAKYGPENATIFYPLLFFLPLTMFTKFRSLAFNGTTIHPFSYYPCIGLENKNLRRRQHDHVEYDHTMS